MKVDRIHWKEPREIKFRLQAKHSPSDRTPDSLGSSRDVPPSSAESESKQSGSNTSSAEQEPLAARRDGDQLRHFA